jgi:SAM-dependent methyltransferase
MSGMPSLEAGRRRVAELLGLPQLHGRIHQLERRVESLETQLHESREEAWERSRTRWRAAEPTPNLTWDVELTGDAFVERAEHHGAFGEGSHVVEIGPGYGRLLATVTDRGLPFAAYTGVDLSETNVRHLTERFSDERVSFVCDDVEQVRFGRPVDAVLSSLTFKHLFPSFERALSNLAEQITAGGVVLFDLIEGSRRYFEDDGITYIRWYERPEVEQILTACGLEPVAFEEVRHHPSLARLLVVGRRPA